MKIKLCGMLMVLVVSAVVFSIFRRDGEEYGISTEGVYLSLDPEESISGFEIESGEEELIEDGMQKESKTITSTSPDLTRQDINSDPIGTIATDEKEEISETERMGEISKNMNTGSQGVSYLPFMEKEVPKEGKEENFEMGLFWDRSSVQRVFYTDVQEICEDAFGDYLSPLQGLTSIMAKEERKYRKRVRTDKQTAVVSQGKTGFYLFLQSDVAWVVIEDKGDTYYASFEVLSEDKAEKIKILELPPTGGLGIIGTDCKPEIQNYDTHKMVMNEGETEYTKADIQLSFDFYVQRMANEAFGDYVQALQGICMIMEQEGYGGEHLGIEEDMGAYMHGLPFETSILEENYFEFTVVLNYEDRARVTITKKGGQYITTFRLLKSEEFRVISSG